MLIRKFIIWRLFVAFICVTSEINTELQDISSNGSGASNHTQNTSREVYRLQTFITFPRQAPVCPVRLARSGFYYTRNKDRVKCFCCGIRVEDWNAAADPTSPLLHFSDCRMMLGEECGNLAITDPLPSLANLTSSTSRRNITREVAHTSSSGPPPPPPPAHGQVLRSLDLKKEFDRIKSFERWTNGTRVVRPSDLARSGFFYLGYSDRCKCFSCKGILSKWRGDDNVEERHRRSFPNCRMVRGEETNNIPLNYERHPAVPSPVSPRIQVSRTQTRSQQNATSSPSDMSTEAARLQTFDHRWPQSITQATPRDIARAGFYFLGERDKVKCWSCNGGLQNWEPRDDPWEEHAKWYPTCEFLLREKGVSFVSGVVSLFPNLRRPVLGQNIPPALSDSSMNIRQARYPPPFEMEQSQVPQRIEEPIDSEIAQVALDLGFDRNLIARVIRRRLAQGDGMYDTSEDLVGALQQEEKPEESFSNTVDVRKERNPELLAPDRVGFGGEPPSSSNSPSNSANNNNEIREENIGNSSVGGINDAEAELRVAKEELRKLEMEKKCKVCMDRDRNAVFFPCRHLAVCMECSANLPERICPICRQRIEQSYRVHPS